VPFFDRFFRKKKRKKTVQSKCKAEKGVFIRENGGYFDVYENGCLLAICATVEVAKGYVEDLTSQEPS